MVSSLRCLCPTSLPQKNGQNDGFLKWFCCCHADCTAVYLSKKGAGSTSMHEHLCDTHGVQEDFTKGRGLGLVKQHKINEDKNAALKHLGPKRYAAIMVTLNIIKLLRLFWCVKDETTHATANTDWVPCSA